MRTIAEDYRNSFQEVEPFYSSPWREWEKRVEELYRLRRREKVPSIYQDEAFYEEILSYNVRLGCSEQTRANINKLKESRALAIITGQQPGIFAGPLYTIYKTMGAIKLAQHIEAQGGIPCVPLFWNASDDHDFEEINHIGLVNKKNEVVSLVLPQPQGMELKPLFLYGLPEALPELVEQMDRETADTEFKEAVIGKLRQSLQGTKSLSDWFSSLMLDLFREKGLILFSSELKEARRLIGPIFEQEIQRPGSSTASLNRAFDVLREKGYQVPLRKKMEELNLFLCVDEQRSKVVHRDGLYEVRESTYNRDDLLSLLRTKPELFSPNVVLRPLAQDYLFPTGAYVAGPTEVAYFAQLKQVYEDFGIPMPIIFPRPEVVLLEKRIKKDLERYRLSLEDMRKAVEQLLPQALEAVPSFEPLVTLFHDTQRRVYEELKNLQDALQGPDPSLSESVRKLQDKMIYEMGKLEKKVAMSQRDELVVVRRQLKNLKNHLFPLDKPQERVLNLFPYFILHGFEFLDYLFERIDLWQSSPQLLEI